MVNMLPAIAACIPAMIYIFRKDIIFNFGLCKTLFSLFSLFSRWRHSLIVNLNFPHSLWNEDDQPIKSLHLYGVFTWSRAFQNLNCKLFMRRNICHVVFVGRTLAIFIQNFRKQKFSLLLIRCYKIYQLSARDMSVNQGLLQDTDTGCNSNFTSNKRLAQTRDSGKLFLGTFDGVWVLLEVRTMRGKVDIILLQYMYSGNLSRLNCRIPSHLVCVFKFLLPQSRSNQININNRI